eukprot:960646-Lingulodinium_polyedra.AAC.1
MEGVGNIGAEDPTFPITTRRGITTLSSRWSDRWQPLRTKRQGRSREGGIEQHAISAVVSAM